MDGISINKYISDTGFCSRREADDYIDQGRVTINTQPAEKGNRVYTGDLVEIDGEPLRKKRKTIYIAFHKPEGITSTTDEKDKTNIISYINHKDRIFPIGRLDKDSEGLIFLTNDGNIVNKILRAGNEHEKEYIVTVDQIITQEFLTQMSEGVRIMGKRTKPCKVTSIGKYVFRIILTQGLNRQIRRMCLVLNYKVKKLVRVRIMNVTLGKLPLGHWRYLTEEETQRIHLLVSESSKTASTTKKKTANTSYFPSSKKIASKEKTTEDYIKEYETQQKIKGKKMGFKAYRKGSKH